MPQKSIFESILFNMGWPVIVRNKVRDDFILLEEINKKKKKEKKKTIFLLKHSRKSKFENLSSI